MVARKDGEDLFFELAIEDIPRTADLFEPHTIAPTGSTVGYPLRFLPRSLMRQGTLAAATSLAAGQQTECLHQDSGHSAGLQAVEEAIFSGVAINITLLFSPEQYVGAATAYLRGIERRIAAGLHPDVPSVASVFISRWDVAVANKVPEHLRGQLGIAVAGKVYRSYQALLRSPRWQRAYNFGAHAQRLLWASTGTKDPGLPDTYYVRALTAPLTVNTMPEATLIAFGDHGEVDRAMSPDQPDVEDVLRRFSEAGIDIDALGLELQNDGAKSFVKSWIELMDVISAKGAELARVG